MFLGSAESHRYFPPTIADSNFVIRIAGSSNIYSYSTDGISWVQSTLPLTHSWNAGIFANGQYILLSNNTSDILYSTDCISWSSTTNGWTLGSDQEFKAVAYMVPDYIFQ